MMPASPVAQPLTGLGAGRHSEGVVSEVEIMLLDGCDFLKCVEEKDVGSILQMVRALFCL